MKKSILFSVIASALFAASCSVTKTISVSAAPIGTKTGTSKTGSVFGFRTNKSFGIAEAAHNGKITGGVAIVDMRVSKSIFAFIYNKSVITVYGQ